MVLEGRGFLAGCSHGIWCTYTLPVAFIVRKQTFPNRSEILSIPAGNVTCAIDC